MKTFPAKRIARVRRRASKAAKLPEDVPSGWSKSTVDPMAVLAVFKPLRTKEGYILRAYQFREGGNGNGFVWALPVDADFPDPEDCPRLQGAFLEPPKPPDALDNVMDAIDGDGSPWSYMCASIFGREISEFGAMWHGCDWDTHRILDADPWDDDQDGQKTGLTEPMAPAAEWEWVQPKPTDWRPQVVQEGNRVTVSFLTFSGQGQEAIYRHMDIYSGSYKFEADRQEVAKGAGGFVF
jgi:hypothetical protein